MSSYPKILSRFDQWLTTQANLHYTALTCHYYLKIIQAFLHFLDAYNISRLSEVSIDLLQKFITQKPDHLPYKPKTILVRQAALAFFYSWAFKQRLCSENVFLRYRKAQVKLKTYDLSEHEEVASNLLILTNKEQQQLVPILASAETFIEKRTAALISLILATGIYQDEICQLTLPNFHWNTNRVSIVVGTRKREVMIDKALCKKPIENWLRSRQEMLNGRRCDWVFFTERLNPLLANKLFLYIRPMLEKAGIAPEKATADCVRQTVVSRWIAKKMPLEKLQQQFGFKQIASLKRYLWHSVTKNIE